VLVVDQLIAPAAVSASVDFLVEVKCETDFEVQSFGGPRWPPTNVPLIQLQSGMASSEKTSDLSTHTFGEAYTSLKQLISIPSRSTYAISTNTTAVIAACPYFYSKPYPSTAPGPVGTAFRSRSFATCGVVSKCFLYANGSTDFHLYDPLVGTAVMVVSAYNTPDFNGQITAGSIWTHRSDANVPRAVFNQDSAHLRFPMLSKVKRIPCSTLDGLTWNLSVPGQTDISTSTTAFPFIISRFFLNNPSTTTKGILISTCAGDDARLYHYMGPLPCVLPSTNAGSVYDPDSLT
jgi:hypothetical protein